MCQCHSLIVAGLECLMLGLESGDPAAMEVMDVSFSFLFF